MAEYAIIVRFVRELGDDRSVIENQSEYDGDTVAKALKKQLAKELQASFECNHCGPAGRFDIIDGPFMMDEEGFDEVLSYKDKFNSRFRVDYAVDVNGATLDGSMEVLAITADTAMQTVKGMIDTIYTNHKLFIKGATPV